MSFHWYDKDGNTAYTVVGKNGKERATDLRDAKKLGLWPSVTTVFSVASKGPMLERYKTNQLLEAAFNETFHDNDIYEEWCKRVVVKSQEHMKNAAATGAELHDALEAHYKKKRVPKKWKGHVKAVVDYIEKYFPDVDDWAAEKSFSHNSYGFGGKVDLHSPKRKIVLDFKTKDKDNVEDMKPYDEHNMQTAAYAVGLFAAEDLEEGAFSRFNLFISTRSVGNMKLTESTNFKKDWNMFKCLLMYWQLVNNHAPQECNNEIRSTNF